MNFDCSLAVGSRSLVVVAGVEAAEKFVFQLKGYVVVGVGSSVAEGFVWSGAEDFRGAFLADFVDHHPKILFSMFFFIIANGQCGPHVQFFATCLGWPLL